MDVLMDFPTKAVQKLHYNPLYFCHKVLILSSKGSTYLDGYERMICNIKFYISFHENHFAKLEIALE